jgi:hypothetical protein
VTYDRKAEVEALLDADDTRIGETFRGDRAGLSPAQQAEQAGVGTQAYVYNNRKVILALTEGKIPERPSFAIIAARKVRAWLSDRTLTLSAELRQDLEETEALLALRAKDRDAQDDEEQIATETTKKVVAAAVPGIYVYTLPHYWRHKVDPDNDQTYLKVGKSATDVFSRVDQQRTTALPEDPVLLRTTPTDDSVGLERKFHAMLDAADHHRTASKKGGREWFLTSLRILDWYANNEGLEIQRPNEDTLGDE